jgi:DNA integrity scanning protein DisA with diadenylate cyclase activity
MELIFAGFKDFLEDADEDSTPLGMRVLHGAKRIPMFRWNVQEIVGYFKKLQQKM